MSDKKSIDIIKGVLKEKPRSKNEWREECKKKGIPQATFYYHFNKLKNNNEIKFYLEENIFQLVERDLADTKEIQLYIDFIKSSNTKLREHGIHDLKHLCATKNVVHDTTLLRFFETVFTDPLYQDVHINLLDAFRLILARALKEGQDGTITKLLENNKTALLTFVREGPLPLQKIALSTLTFRLTRETLNYLYELIERKNNNEYQILQAIILKTLRSCLEDYRLEIKTKLFEIATTNVKTEVKDRAIDLLGDLSAVE